MIKKLLKLTVSAAILTTMIQVTPTFADTPVTQSQIDATQEQVDNFETRMQQLDDRIMVSMDKSKTLNDNIKAQQDKITQTTVEIDKAQKSLDTHKEVYSERLKSIQLEGKTSIVTYAELLLSANDISEFFTRFTAISNIMESDTDLLNGLNEKQQSLKNAEEKLHNEFDQLKKSQAQLASEQKKIEEDKKEVEKELANAENTLQSQQGQLAKQEAERQAQIAQQLARQQQSQKKTTVTHVAQSTPSVDATNLSSSEAANQVIAYAKQFLGVPYVWGGTTPSGFDCSGFTSYVFRNSVGINLPRVSRDQQNVGIRISPSDVQPGDLVFRGSPAYHVGIYIGGGQYIHAPQTGDVVKISSYNPAKFTSAARILR